MLSDSTIPELIRSSPKCDTSMPFCSWRLNSIPDRVKRSIESWAYMSSLRSVSGCASHERVKSVLEAELEVELPCTSAERIVALRIGERQTKLNDLQQINVAAKSLVVIVCRGAEISDRSGDDSGELSILHRCMSDREQRGRKARRSCHCNVGVLLEELTDVAHFLFQIVCPDIADAVLRFALFKGLMRYFLSPHRARSLHQRPNEVSPAPRAVLGAVAVETGPPAGRDSTQTTNSCTRRAWPRPPTPYALPWGPLDELTP